MDTQPSASTSRAIGPSTIPIPTVRPTVVGSDERITQTSGDHMGPPASEPVIVDDPGSPERFQAPEESIPLLTPPPTQLQPPQLQPLQGGTGNSPAWIPSATNFPVDPSILEFTNLSQEDGPLPPGVPQILVEPSLELDSASAVEVDEMPSPPLPSESEPQLNDPSAENRTASTTLAKSKRGRRGTVKEPKPRKGRKTAKSQDAHTEGQENGAEAEQAETKPRRKRSSQEKIEALDQEAARAAETEDAEPLDPTTAAMPSLFESDIGTGRLSSKYLEKGIAYVKHVEEWRESCHQERKWTRTGTLLPVPLDGELGASLSPSPEREPGSAEETFAESAAAPQIRFVNGEMVLDEDSQFYDRAGATVQDEDPMVVVDEANFTRFSNSNSFMRKAGSRGSGWTADETELFYWCLSAFGEYYESTARYLGRTPLQCKNKTKSEDRRGNEKRITLAVKTRIPLDHEEFGGITGRDFSGPPPEICAPVAPPRAENEEQAPVTSSVKAKATSSTPSTTPRKNRKLNSHAEEEIMTLEEYERTERVTNTAL
ncbi:Transcription factor TFIIIB component B [Ceratobasidium sp. 423]|nr:Transcription factor TFIIIB component B [Ceratobasidium sp. 423]